MLGAGCGVGTERSPSGGLQPSSHSGTAATWRAGHGPLLTAMGGYCEPGGQGDIRHG